MCTNKVPSLVKMKCIRIPLRFNRRTLIKTENIKLRNEATRRTWDDAQLMRLRRERRIPEPNTGEKTAENKDRFAGVRSSYKQKLAW